MKDLRRRFSTEDETFLDWGIAPRDYTIQAVATKLQEFIAEKVAAAEGDMFMRLRICGYSSGQPLPEIWDVVVNGRQCDAPTSVQDQANFGIRWAGEMEALDRLLLGIGSGFKAVAVKLGVPQDTVNDATNSLIAELGEQLAMSAMPIQDAIDLARYCVESTVGFVKFAVKRPKTVGGPIEIATITKHEGFK